jgi:quercetin dioxygenase-like cupin family protein
MKPLVKTESCQKSHVLYVISGKFRVKMDDGTEEEYGTGDIGVMPPGHDVWTVGDKPAVLLEISL